MTPEPPTSVHIPMAGMTPLIADYLETGVRFDTTSPDAVAAFVRDLFGAHACVQSHRGFLICFDEACDAVEFKLTFADHLES